MKKVLMVALALFISVAFVTTVCAQGKPPKILSFEGKVTKVEGTRVTVTNPKLGEKTFDVTGAQFVGGKDVRGIKVHDHIDIRYYVKDGKNITTWVNIARSLNMK